MSKKDREIYTELSYTTSVKIWVSEEEYNELLLNSINTIRDISNKIKSYISIEDINAEDFIITESNIPNLEE